MTGGRRFHRAVIVARPLTTVTALVFGYYRLPLAPPAGVRAAAWLAAGLALVVVVLVSEVRAIVRSSRPRWQGVQALALVVPLFLLVFAYGYGLLAHAEPGSFGTPLGHTDALYFTVTVFATVGFGDIAPVSPAARVVVTVQMVGDVVLLGGALRVLMTAVQRRKREVEG